MSRFVHPCCESITSRHSQLCDYYTPSGKRRVSEAGQRVLRKLAEVDGPLILRVHSTTVQALVRRHLVTARPDLPGQWRCAATPRGRMASMFYQHGRPAA